MPATNNTEVLNDEEEELIPVTTPPKTVDKPADDPDEEENDDDDVDNGDAAKDEEGDRRVKRVDGDHGDESPEAVRERRRQEKRDRKAKREAAMRRDKAELALLRQRNEDLERRFSGVEAHVVQKHAADIDNELSRMQNQLKLAEDVMAKAIAAQNGEDAAKAMRFRDEARDRLRALTEAKGHFQQQLNNQTNDGRTQPQQNGPAPRVIQLAKKFVADNPWYDAGGGNEDSAIMLAIDSTLVREGYDPASEEYWEELVARGKRRLPERFGSSQQTQRTARDVETAERKPKGGPALGGGREASSSTRKEFYVSPERKQAMIESGAWDDPVLRAKMIKRYAQYDKEASERRR